MQDQKKDMDQKHPASSTSTPGQVPKKTDDTRNNPA